MAQYCQMLLRTCLFVSGGLESDENSHMVIEPSHAGRDAKCPLDWFNFCCRSSVTCSKNEEGGALASLINCMALLFCTQVYVSALRLVRKMVRRPLYEHAGCLIAFLVPTGSPSHSVQCFLLGSPKRPLNTFYGQPEVH